MNPAGTNYYVSPLMIDYGSAIEQEISTLEELIREQESLLQKFQPRWLALKLLQQDADILQKLSGTGGVEPVLAAAESSISRLDGIYGDDLDTIITDRRYSWIHEQTLQVLERPAAAVETLTDKLDRIFTSRILGMPIFLAMMWIVFKITTDISGPFLDWVDGLFSGPVTNWVVALLWTLNLNGTWVESLAVDGVIGGVGGVLVFVPVLMSLYFALAVLEDSGYMARAAFVMDRLMHSLGLHGKSFLPMIVGFGCTVPAIYTTRTLESEKDRILTGLLVPFMSCGARLPVYVLFASIFFPQNTGTVIFGLYLTGIALAVLIGMILKHTVFRDKEESLFVMELPPYRLPTLKSIWLHLWERTSAFIRKAWSIILATSVIIWLLLAIPTTPEAGFNDGSVDQSAFATISQITSPLFKPLGFGEWEASGSLITGFVAKEVVVGTMAQVYNVEEEGEADESDDPPTFGEDLVEIGTSFLGAAVDTVKSIPLIVGIDLFEGEEEAEPTLLMQAVEQSFEKSSGGNGALASLSFMLFVLLYTPCMVAVAAQRQEFGSKWMWVSIIGQFVIAWLVSFLVYQGGLLLNL